MSRWNFLFRSRKRDAQLDSELRFHIEELTDANVAAGMAPEEARRRAVLEFGGTQQVKEDLQELFSLHFVDLVLTNLKSAFRFLRKSPSFSLAVILTLAIAIGANSAVFSAIDAILLRPLPFPDGDQLVRVSQYNPKVNNPDSFVAPIRLEEWNRTNSTFQALTGYYTEDSTETSGALPEKVSLAWVAPRFLQVWGVAPARGRDFDPEEESFGGPQAVLISDRFWRQRFNADPDILHKSLRMYESSFPIVGVMPASFLFPIRNVDIWSPIPPNAPYCQDRNSTWYTVIGRMKPQVTPALALSNLAAVQAQLGKAYPKPDGDLDVSLRQLREVTVSGSRRSLWILFGSVSLLLLIACTNIVSLLLARSTQREHEISVRFSLGASRFAVVSQLLTEAFILAVIGSVLGLFVAWGASGAFRALAADLPRVEEIHLDARIVLYSLVCSVVVTFLCGLIPALRATQSHLSRSLAQNSRSQVSSQTPLQWLLVGVQVALAVTLLSGAGLLYRSLVELGRVSPGFDASHVLTFHVTASWGETIDMQKLTERIDRTLEELRSVPGVEFYSQCGGFAWRTLEIPNRSEIS